MIPAKVKAEAIALAKHGVPHREVARRVTSKYRISVSPSAVRVWLRADGVPAQAQPDQHPPPEPPKAKRKPRREAPSAKAEPSAPPAPEPPPLELADPAPAWTPPIETPVAPAVGSPVELLREMLAQQRQEIAEAKAQGNSQVVAKLMRDLSDTTKNLATAEKDAAKALGANGGFIMSRAEIDAGLREVEEQIGKLAAIPLTCEHCGRAMRVRVASNGEAES